MEVVPAQPLCASSVVWQSGASRVLTLVCKATFKLAPGESALAESQESVHEDDAYWDDDPTKSIYAPSDLVPFKARADVILVGNAFAPRGEPARSVVVRMIVGEIDKAIEVLVDRAWSQDNVLHEGARFARMPLRYERAAGGPDTSNPIGMRADARPNSFGMVPLPNLQPPGLNIAARSDVIAPIGLGPIAPTWPLRREKLGRLAATGLLGRWSAAPLPLDIDPAYFNSAPRDQQIDELRVNERIILENLHPDHPRLVTSLPGVRPRAFLDLVGRAPQEVGMRCETLWIDSGRSICTLTWRGHLENPPTGGRIRIALERPGQALMWPDLEQQSRAQPASERKPPEESKEPTPWVRAQTVTFIGADRQGPPSSAAVLPFARTSSSALSPFAAPPPPASPTSDLPFAPDSRAARAPDPLLGAASAPLPSSLGASSPSWLAAPRAPSPSGLPPSMPLSQPQPPPVVAPAFEPPPSVPLPAPSSSSGAAAADSSPWAGSSASPSFLAVPPPTPGLGFRPAMAVAAAAGGAAAASDAATDHEPYSTPAPAPPTRPVAPIVAAPTRSEPSDAIELLWHEESAVPRVRAWWEELITELDFEPADTRQDLEPANPDNARSRHNVFGVLSDGDATDSAGVAPAVLGAVNDKGRFTAPLLLLAGELRFPFDELETLKATIVAATPLSGGDKRLKETLDAMNDLLKMSYLQGSTSVITRLTQQLKEQFAQSNRALPPDYLDAYVERSLLEQRRYQIRKVFGGEFIRALLAPPRSSDAPVPVYLPKDLDQKLPMVIGLRARLIVEAHPQQDQYEASLYALRVIALGRSLPLDAWRRPARG